MATTSDAPECKEATQYLCLAYDKQERSKGEASEQSINMRTQLDGVAASAILPGMMGDDDSETSTSTSAQRSKKDLERQQKLLERQQEREAEKNDPMFKAKKWADGLLKDIAKVEIQKVQVSQSKCTADTKKVYDDIFTQNQQKMVEVQQQLSNADRTNAESLVLQAPAVLESFKESMKSWRKAMAAASGLPQK